jgi:hypothetical protein
MSPDAMMAKDSLSAKLAKDRPPLDEATLSNVAGGAAVPDLDAIWAQFDAALPAAMKAAQQAWGGVAEDCLMMSQPVV